MPLSQVPSPLAAPGPRSPRARTGRLAVLGLLCLDACGHAPRCGPDSARVNRVIDGDTVVLAGGQIVRYLMIDAPEITDGHHDCYGSEAREFNRALVEGRELQLGYDEQCEDRYGRLLAYASVDGRELNALLIERGYACLLYIPPNGSERRSEFEALEALAESQGRGLWGACNPRPCAK